MPSPDITTSFDSGHLDDKALVMNMLSSETDATYTFQGMRRRLGLHQEKLTRILKRLEDDNLVLKTDDGYRVLGSPKKSSHRPDDGEPVIRGQLPPGIDKLTLTTKLKGRWFKNFRWLGYSTSEAGQSLYWITENGRFQLVVRLASSEILVWSHPTGDIETQSPIAAGYELFDRISRILPETEDNS